MRKENLEKISSEKLLTAPEVIYKLLQKHPEIMQISVCSYVPRPHGQNAKENYREYIPIDYEISSLADGEWKRADFRFGEAEAIGSMVDVCPRENCDHSLRRHFDDQLYLWQSWHDGLEAPHGIQKSFIFLDIEIKEQPEVLGKITEVLKNIDNDWYVLDSGNGFHVIIDRLVDLKQLPIEYGKTIAFFGEKLGNRQLWCWGESLKRTGDNPYKVRCWIKDVLEEVGHINDNQDKEVHIIDLRHIAHSLERVEEYQDFLAESSYQPGFAYRKSDKIGGVYLRISPKNEESMPPVLVIQKEGQKIQFFRKLDYLLKPQKQQRLF